MPESGTSKTTPFDPAAAHRSVFQALSDARAEHGGATIALVDGETAP